MELPTCRQYIGSRGYRKIPVGYSAADVSENRLQMAEYMNCGTDDERSDFFAFNDYSYCDPATYDESGWPEKVTMFSNYSLPLLLANIRARSRYRADFDAAFLSTGASRTHVTSWK